MRKIVKPKQVKPKRSLVEEKEFEKYLEKIEDPNYQGGSWALPENASTSEKIKYEICKQMIIHKREKKLSTEKIAQKIALSPAETDDILHYRTTYFTLDRLVNYAGKLLPKVEIGISLKENNAPKVSRKNLRI